MHVYLINNTVTGKVYIGQHSGNNLNAYLRVNMSVAKRGGNGKPLLYRAIRKYGIEAFNIRSIYTASDKEEMDRAEIAFIKLFGTTNRTVGYNLAFGGGGTLGYSPSETAREKISKTLTGKPMSAAQRASISVAQQKRQARVKEENESKGIFSKRALKRARALKRKQSA